MPKFTKRIADPIHGTIPLTEIEVKLVDTRSFQRLRNVKQLGLAHLVYPAVDYSRLSHSIGVCHVTGRELEAIKPWAKGRIDDRELQRYRLAGLLHDLGHYPFSHALEHALSARATSRLVAPAAGLTPQGGASAGSPSGDPPASGPDDPPMVAPNASAALDSPVDWWDHETVGKKLLELDAEIPALLRNSEYQFRPEEIWRVFTREEQPEFANLVSSDLDADRIDYLLRTARHSGLPYGSVDLDYLLARMRLDDENRVCLEDQALKTVDHFLLARYFDYQQVAYHKTVVGLELLLQDVVQGVLDRGLDLSPAAVEGMIKNGKWAAFDDADMVVRIRDLAANAARDEVLAEKANAVIHRNPPRMVFSEERLGKRGKAEGNGDFREHKARFRKLAGAIPRWAQRTGIPSPHWRTWEMDAVLTKIGSRIPTSALVADSNEEDREALEQIVRVLPRGASTSKLIIDDRTSLMSVLANYALYALRLYVLLPTSSNRTRRLEIEQMVQKDMSD